MSISRPLTQAEQDAALLLAREKCVDVITRETQSLVGRLAKLGVGITDIGAIIDTEVARMNAEQARIIADLRRKLSAWPNCQSGALN